MSSFITTLDDLHALYGTPPEAARIKVVPGLTPGYRAHVERARFCVLTTVGPEGTDASPRGDDGPVVRVTGTRQLMMPDWKGNERIDSLRNIVRDGRVSLMFLNSGSNTVMRVNGRARLTADADLRDSFARDGRAPRTVIIIDIDEVYPQCARALMRAQLWTGGDMSAGLPGIGALLAEVAGDDFDGAAYDAAWPARAQVSMW